MEVIRGIPVWGQPVDSEALRQIELVTGNDRPAALMADHHVGYSMPIGGVVAYRDEVSPSGVGFDIVCGNKAVLTDLHGKEVRRDIKRLMDDIVKAISFGMGRSNSERVDHELFDDPAWKLAPVKAIKLKAQTQLGTVGSGNHYVDVFVDEEDRVWIGVHFGSRGLGHTIATFFIKEGGGKDGMFVPPVVLKVGTALADDYLTLMHLAGQYAYAGRDYVCQKVCDILGGSIVEEVHNHHNFAWLEEHSGEKVWVVRKGATPAFPGQLGFVGGSMADKSVILMGKESDESRQALYSTVHGAGRVMSRTAAAGRVKNGVRQGGRITREMMMKVLKHKKVELRGAGTDESPQVYKRLKDVLGHHSETVEIITKLTPIGVAMAGENEFDPYKN